MLVEDDNLKRWLSTVSNSSLGQIVKSPNGLIKTLTSISLHGPTGMIHIKKKEATSVYLFIIIY